MNYNNIDERDIFNFVFFRKILSNEKIKIIKSNIKLLLAANFYEKLKTSLNEELSSEIKRKIASKIPSYQFKESVFFFQLTKQRTKDKTEIPILAADSPTETPVVKAKTFLEKSNQYIIRLLNFKNYSRLYVFSINDEVLKNYKIILQPTGEEFFVDDNTKPLELNKIIEPENIEIKFES